MATYPLLSAVAWTGLPDPSVPVIWPPGWNYELRCELSVIRCGSHLLWSTSSLWQLCQGGVRASRSGGRDICCVFPVSWRRRDDFPVSRGTVGKCLTIAGPCYCDRSSISIHGYNLSTRNGIQTLLIFYTNSYLNLPRKRPDRRGGRLNYRLCSGLIAISSLCQGSI